MPHIGLPELLVLMVTLLILMIPILLIISVTGRKVTVTCPRCGTETRRGGYSWWQILVAILFFPIGLLALAAGRQPTECTDCGFRWQA